MANKNIKAPIKFDPDDEKYSLSYNFDYNKEETSELHKLLNNNSSIDINDLRRVSLWKLNRILNVSDNTIKDLRKLASLKNIEIDSEFSKNIINKLVSSDGIGFPMASAILKFIRPDIFPIIDVRAYRALTGNKIYSSQYKIELYTKYAQQLRKYADKLKGTSKNNSLRGILSLCSF